MNRKTKGILTLLFVFFSCFTTIVSVIGCSVSKSSFQLYGSLYKDVVFILWIISYYLIISYVIANKKKRTVIAFAVLFGLLFSVQMAFVFNAFYFIEIQHYFSWNYDITYLQVLARDVSYDFSHGELKYLCLFFMMFIICVLRATFASKCFKAKILRMFPSRYEDDDEEFYEFMAAVEMGNKKEKEQYQNSTKGKLNKSPSQGKLNSRARALARKARK